MKPVKRINLTPQQVDDLLDRVKNSSLQQSDYEIIKAMAEMIKALSQAVDQKGTSIRRLLRMMFGPGSEKLEKVIKDQIKQSKTPSDKNKEKPNGHGRNSAFDYTGAEEIEVPHPTLKPGDKCPLCPKGKVYRMESPCVLVRVTGKAPLQAAVYKMERLRCNLCGEIFKAKPPPGIGEEKYDASSGAMIALLKYGSGMPFNRLEQLQASVGIPLPASTQWDIVEHVADKVYPVFEELKRQAAQGEVIYNDDTTVKILSLMKENKEDKTEKKGMFTTGILSTVNDRKISLFLTGRKHSGQNMDDLIEKRTPNTKRPIQMCDALSRNTPKAFKTLLANCLAHGRRKFVDVAWNFPQECQYVLETFAKVYKNEKIVKTKQMNPEKRLSFHKSKSGPLMDELKKWFKQQIEEKKVEPNSGLGEAIAYMQNHWKPLTLFLRMPNAPLDNNICEQALKKAILHRKNALFYKTEHG
ncbi:MAG: IS66 family transposase, partial [Desulfobacterales bacterium]